MKRIAVAFAITIAALGAPVRARAADSNNVTIVVAGGHVQACERHFTPPAKPPAQVMILVGQKTADGGFAPAGAPEDLTITAGALSRTLKKGDKELKLDGVPEDAATLTIVGQAGPACDGVALVQPAPSVLHPTAASAAESDNALIMQQARAYYETTADKSTEGGALGRKFKIYHLPDCSLAEPLPSHINEKDRLELIVLGPTDAQVTFEIVTCEAVPGLRILGSYADAAKIGTVPISGLRTVTAELRIVPYVHKQFVQCAGTLVYKVTVKRQGQPDITTTMSVVFDPVYRLAWGAGLVFDFVRPISYSLKPRPAATGTGSETFVAQSRDYGGVRPIILLGLHYCGANPLDWTWCDRIPTPFIAIDPSRIDQGFMVGANFQPFSGVGIVGGLSVYKSEVINSGAMVTPNQVWTAPGDLPKHSEFNSDGIGGFVGIAVTSDVLGKLLSVK